MSETCDLCKQPWVLFTFGEYFCAEHVRLLELLSYEETLEWEGGEEDVERLVTLGFE
jgi:hypothetical protein